MEQVGCPEEVGGAEARRVCGRGDGSLKGWVHDWISVDQCVGMGVVRLEWAGSERGGVGNSHPHTSHL